MTLPLLIFLVLVLLVVVAVCAAYAYTEIVSSLLYRGVRWDSLGGGMLALAGAVVGVWGILRLLLG